MDASELIRGLLCSRHDFPEATSLDRIARRRPNARLLACGSGAYNVTTVPFVATRQGRTIIIEPAPFDVELEQWEEEEGHRVLINGDWDAATRTLSDFSKGRGLGDCGTRSSYGWDGARFRLVHREEMPECRGSVVHLTTWRADVQR